MDRALDRAESYLACGVDALMLEFDTLNAVIGTPKLLALAQRRD